jgi:2-deoxy-D-gluconate 3-dehydrogenase
MIENLFSLKGRVALVTGGSRGIGKMIARGYLESGAKVYISSRKADACDETAGELSAYGPCIPLPQDVSTVAGCQALAGKIKSPFFLTQALFGALKSAASADRPAKVINIASIDGIRLNPWETYSYHASKSGLLYLTRRMAARLIKDNIVMTAIAPGAFASEMNKVARDHADMVATRIPAKRIGRDEDMAAAAIFLASKAGDYVVGDSIAVDGGVAYASIAEI